ncbi:protein kinase domain-containing protein [Streptomyces sp. NPDC001443]
MGRVWRAVDEILDRPVAVKEMRIDGLDAEDTRTRRERTLREARATARIDHPHVVRVYDVVDEGERLWIVMELVAGRSLERVIVEDGPLGPGETARIGLGLVAALRQVHAGGVLHRDIKPGNVLVEGGGRRVVLTDFGIAAIQDAKALTMVGMLVGSPDYMAPERISGRHQGPPSDVWSLGATLCAALGGRSPFSRGTTLATLHAVLYEEPELPASAGPLHGVLAALLEKEPAVRPSLEDVESALRPIAFPDPTPTLAVGGGGGPAGVRPAADSATAEPDAPPGATSPTEPRPPDEPGPTAGYEPEHQPTEEAGPTAVQGSEPSALERGVEPRAVYEVRARTVAEPEAGNAAAPGAGDASAAPTATGSGPEPAPVPVPASAVPAQASSAPEAPPEPAPSPEPEAPSATPEGLPPMPRDPAPTAGHPAPGLRDLDPGPQDAAAAAGDPAPGARDPAPPARDPAPVGRDSGPDAESPTRVLPRLSGRPSTPDVVDASRLPGPRDPRESAAAPVQDAIPSPSPAAPQDAPPVPPVPPVPPEAAGPAGPAGPAERTGTGPAPREAATDAVFEARSEAWSEARSEVRSETSSSNAGNGSGVRGTGDTGRTGEAGGTGPAGAGAGAGAVGRTPEAGPRAADAAAAHAQAATERRPLPVPPAPPPERTTGPPSPARARRRGAVLVAAGAAAATGAVVAVVLAMSSSPPAGTRAGSSSPKASASAPAPTSGTPAPTVEGTFRPPSLPPGAHQEAGGFAWVTPKGWRRDVKTGAEVHYTSPDGTQELVAKSSLARGDLMDTWRTSEQNAHQGQDYRKIRLDETTFRGHPAVVWEYTFTLKGVQWHARLLGFDASGKSYQINTWYQPRIETRAVRTYDRVKDGFTLL